MMPERMPDTYRTSFIKGKKKTKVLWMSNMEVQAREVEDYAPKDQHVDKPYWISPISLRFA